MGKEQKKKNDVVVYNLPKSGEQQAEERCKEDEKACIKIYRKKKRNGEH